MSHLQVVLRTLAPSAVGPSPAAARAVRAFALVTADLTAFAAALTLAFVLGAAVSSEPPLNRAADEIVQTGAWWHGWGTMFVLIYLLGYLYSRGHYSERIPFWMETGTIIGAVFVAFVFEGFLKIAIYSFAFGYEATVRWLLFVPIALLCRQAARSALEMCGVWTLRTLVVGDATTIDCVREALQSQPRLGYRVVGAIDLDATDHSDDNELWDKRARLHAADFIVLAPGGGGGGRYRTIISALIRGHAPFAVVPTFDGLPVLGFSHQYFFSHDIVMLVWRNNLARPLSRLVKQLFDYIVAGLLLIALTPLFLTIALLVCADGGPVFFAHRRIGANGKPFKCLKFRTMAVDADQILDGVLRSDPASRAEWAATRKLQSDPRITPVGRVLRKSSLDELPQLLNILRGEMSLVGPRPIVEEEIARYAEDIDHYYEAKPGITGLWQVSGRSRATYDRRVQLDVWYVKNWTLWHDVTILLKTIPAVLRKDGAV